LALSCSLARYNQSFIITAHALWHAAKGELPTREARDDVNAFTMVTRLPVIQATGMDAILLLHSQVNHLHLTALHLFLNPHEILPFMQLCTAPSHLFDPHPQLSTYRIDRVSLQTGVQICLPWLPRVISQWRPVGTARGYMRRCINGTPDMWPLFVQLWWDTGEDSRFSGVGSFGELAVAISAGSLNELSGGMRFEMISSGGTGPVTYCQGHLTPWGFRGRYSVQEFDGFFAMWIVHDANLNIWADILGQADM